MNATPFEACLFPQNQKFLIHDLTTESHFSTFLPIGIVEVTFSEISSDFNEDSFILQGGKKV